MNSHQRLQYLSAMGITVWQARTAINNTVQTESDNEINHDITTAQTLHSVEIKAIETPVINMTTIANNTAIIEQNNNTDTWQLLETEVINCTKCALCQTRTQTVFGSGNKNARWLIVGEAPGEQEDLQGKPFVGIAGQLLTEMLFAINLNRENDVFIANILKCRPPNNRDPHVDEIKSCMAYLERTRALVQPKLILAVGRIAAQTLLKTNEPLIKLRGKIHYLENTPLIVVYHPAYLLRSLIKKREAWQDLQFALQTMEAIN